MRRLIISDNPLEPTSYTVTEEPKSIIAELMTRFPEWPDTARVYNGLPCQENEVAIFDEDSVLALDDLKGDIYVIVYPGKFIALPFLILAVAVVAVVAVTMLLIPKPQIPDVAAADAARNLQSSSPNNELADRTNRSRLNGRIPDIFGTVRSTPDLIAQTYNYYESNRKVEISYMCIGRGEYAIGDVRDGDTPLVQIAGSSAEFYGPGTSPANSEPVYSVGSAITDTLVRAKRLEQVVGQELRPPNSASYSGASLKFQYPDRIFTSDGTNLQDSFLAGDQVTVAGSYTGTTDNINTTATSRYVWNGGDPYVEWQAGDPRTTLQAGDAMTISNSSVTPTKKPITVTRTLSARFASTGRIYFDDTGSDNPIDLGDDFRTNKDFTVSGASFTYNLAGSYVVSSKPNSATLQLTGYLGVTNDWSAINGNTSYMSATVNGITRAAVRFTSAGRVELQAGNFADVNVGDTIAIASDATFSYSLNGTYQFTSSNSGANYWVINSPSSVTADWNLIASTTGYKNITVTQIHSTDTVITNFDGTYTIASLTASRIYLAGTNVSWSRLSGYLNERTEYPANTDTFSVTAPTRTVNLGGTFTLVSVGLYEVILSNPALSAPDWDKLQNFPSNTVQPAASSMATTGGNWVGPFFLDEPAMTKVYTSFIAANGIYKDDGKNQTRSQVELDVALYPADENGIATGAAAQTVNLFLTGSAVQRDTIATTQKIILTRTGRHLVYVRRVTPKDTAFDGQVVDTVKWEELYMMAPETKLHFGNITTVYTKTYATGGALAVKERKLNCLVTRKVPYITGWTGAYPDFLPVYHADPQPTNNAAQIFCAVALDPQIGNRDISEIDAYGIFGALQQVQDYFGSSAATEFCYTFDNNNISFEECTVSIANAVFCVAYRQGSKIMWKPEIADGEPVLIFNHRNKLPKSEQRTVRFGPENDFDSIQLTWVNPDDDSVETFFIPEDQSGVSPKKVETIGIRNITQATWQAWRAYYKMLYQNTNVEFDSTQEAAILVQRDRVLVADNTRADTQDGEVWDQEVLQLTLSQEVKLEPGVSYTIFLQHIDGSVEGIPVTGVPDNLSMVKTVFIRQDGGMRFPTPADAGNFSPGDIVAITATAYVDPVNGSLNFDGVYTIDTVDGLTGIIRFVNPAGVDPDWGSISETEHSRVGVNFNATRYAKRKVNLATAPRMTLNLDSDAYARTTYTIRGNTEVAPSTFMVAEVRPKDAFTFHVTAANYDSRYYYLDDLEFWMNFDDGSIRDASARAHVVYTSTTPTKAHTAFDDLRSGNVFSNDANSSAAWVKCDDLIGHRGSYTKAVWVRQAGGFDSYFLSNLMEQFRVNTSNRIIATHRGVDIHTTEAGQLYRLYRTAYNRAHTVPDFCARLYSMVHDSVTLSALTATFLASAEGVAMFGALDEAAFITKVYQNGLGRAPDAGELASWAGQPRATILNGVSESAEAVTHWAASVTATITAANGNFVSVTWPTANDEWHHACITYDAAKCILKMYVNGVLVAQNASFYVPISGDAIQPIGLASTGVVFRAADDVRYWKKAFSEQQVSDLYNATR